MLLTTGFLVDVSESPHKIVALALQDTDEEETASGEDQPVSMDEDELRVMIEQSVAKRVRPLQREIADLKETIRLHDILGGIGFIMGLAGITFYFLGIRKRDRMESEKD